MSLFQTFVINNWGFLTRDVAGVGNASISNPEALRKIMRYIGGAFATNVVFEDVLQTRSPFPAPLHAFAKMADSDDDQLKALGAAMAASGAVALYHADGITPEAHLHDPSGLEKITVGEKEMKEAYDKLNTGADPDIVIVGCPHASLREIAQLAEILDGQTLTKPVWICTSRLMKEAAVRMGYNDTIENAGGRIVADTCMVVSPIEDMGFGTTGVNSGKAAAYLPGFCKQEVCYANVRDLVKKQGSA